MADPAFGGEGGPAFSPAPDGPAFQVADASDAINPHFIQPGSIPSFAGRRPDTRGDANYSRPPLQPVPGSGSFTGKVG